MPGVIASSEKLQDFYQELEQLLRKQLEQQPGLDDVRLKLLELFFEQHRRDDFVTAARALQRRLGAAAATSRDWQRIASMGRMLAPGESLFSSQASDRVEFVALPGAATAPEPARVRRFGDDERYRNLFEALARGYAAQRADARFLAELELALLGLPARRPTPLLHARRLSEHLGGAQLHIKREDLAGDNPHLTIAVMGQALLARRLGRTTLVTATSDGRRGVTTAAVGARLGLKTIVFMDPDQLQRRAAHVLFMRIMGAEVRAVATMNLRNGDVREAALEHWAASPDETLLVMGLDSAPPPYPVMTQEFTAAIGRECRRQATGALKRVPDVVVTRGRGAPDALGVFPAFFADAGTQLVCVDAEAPPEVEPRKADDPYTQVGMPMTAGERQVARSVLDRLEYPSVAREHALLRASGRVQYLATSRDEARTALQDFARLEGVVASIETAHVLAWACAAARRLPSGQAVVVVQADDAAKDAWDIRELVDGDTRAPPRKR